MRIVGNSLGYRLLAVGDWLSGRYSGFFLKNNESHFYKNTGPKLTAKPKGLYSYVFLVVFLYQN